MASTYTYTGVYILNLSTGEVQDAGVTLAITESSGGGTFNNTADPDQSFAVSGSSVDGTYSYTTTTLAGDARITAGTETITGQFGFFSSGGQDYLFLIPNTATDTAATAWTPSDTFSGVALTTTGFDYADVRSEGDDTVTLDDAVGATVDGADGSDSLSGSNQADVLLGGAGNDTLRGRGGADSIVGGQGDDLLFGNGGNDTIEGDGDPGARLGFRWSDLPDPDDNQFIDDEDVFADSDTTGAAVQDTGGILVSVDYDEVNTGARDLTFQNVANNITDIDGGSATVNPNSSGQLFGNRAGASDTDTSVLTFNFSSVSPRFEDGVTNVQFRINDLDQNFPGGFRDEVFIEAFGPGGTPVAITLDGGAGLTLVDTDSDGFFDTATANQNGLNNISPDGSLLVEVAGPVVEIRITYRNLGTSNQAATVTDVYFDAVPVAGGNDDIRAGGGNDSVLGQEGNDTIQGQGGDDIIDGGVGDDELRGDAGADTILGGAGNDLLIGGADTDTLTGGDGFDTFVADGSDDQITDFNFATGQILNDGDLTNNDLLDLSASYNPGTLAAYNAANGTNFTQAISALRHDAADDVLDFAGGVRLPGVDEDQLFFDNTRVVCFTPGAQVTTVTGPVAVEALQVGSLIVTRDHGIQPIEWIANRTLSPAEFVVHPSLCPVRISRGALGPNRPSRDMVVSPQHRFLVSGRRAALYFGKPEVLVPAIALVDGVNIRREAQHTSLTYIHFLCARHELVRVDNVWTESLFFGEMAEGAITEEGRREIELIFGELPTVRPARPFLSKSETRILDLQPA